MIDDFSAEAEKAMQIALSVLNGDKPGKPESAQPRPVVTETADENEMPPRNAELREIQVTRIAQRNAISLTENYVLIMEGLSTYRFDHPRGTTFIIDNSRYNRDRDLHQRQASEDAMNLARVRGLDRVYVLD